MKEKFIFYAQIVILNFFYFIFNTFTKKKNSGTIIGLNNISGTTDFLAEKLDKPTTVIISNNKAFQKKYTFNLSKNYLSRKLHFLLTPIILSYYLTKKKKFIYVGSAGYLNNYDGREYEFRFLKRNNKEIFCYFTGSDIRSIKLIKRYSQVNKIDTIITYTELMKDRKYIQNDDHKKKLLAIAADKYATRTYNYSTDQMSYMRKKSSPPLLYARKEEISFFPKKFRKGQLIEISHIYSNALNKGTPLVRAAIKKLQEENYKFHYTEFTNTNHTNIIQQLKKTHIVLSEFYAFCLGVLSVEALMYNCVLLCSADEKVEPMLPKGANQAWTVTKYWQIYSNLKNTLDLSHEELKVKADKGTKWIDNYADTVASKESIRAYFN